MPDRLIPPGYQAVLIGSATTLEGLSAFVPMEEAAAEGNLMLMRLDFGEFLSTETLTELERALRDQGVPAWPGYPYLVYADAGTPSVYVAWQKGGIGTAIIIGLLILMALPLIGGIIWAILPETLKDLISMFLQMGVMLLMLWLVSKLMKPLIAPAPRRPRELEAPRR